MIATPLLRSLAGGVIVLLLSGCASGEKSTNAPHPISSQTLQSIRDQYFRVYPESRVGVIIANRPKNHLVAVGDVTPAEFAIGQAVYFLDSRRAVLTTGRIVRIMARWVIAEYDPPPPGVRAPETGDVMVRLPLGVPPL